MSRIGNYSYQPVKSMPRGTQSKSAKIAALQMEIARINNQAQMRLIPQAEASLKIAALEAKINEIESNNDFETAQTQEVAGIQNQNGDFQVAGAESGNNDGGQDSLNDNDNYGKNDYSFCQAEYNKALFGLK